MMKTWQKIIILILFGLVVRTTVFPMVFCSIGEKAPIINVKDSTNYPVVSKLEQQVFNQTYESEDITKRLDRLEKKVFGSSVSSSSLSDRVDNLQAAIVPTDDNPAPQVEKVSSNTLISELEMDVLDETYPQDTVEARVGRMEEKLFNQTSPDDELGSRLERIISVVKAMPGSKHIAQQSKESKFGKVAVMVLTTGFIVLMFLL